MIVGNKSVTKMHFNSVSCGVCGCKYMIFFNCSTKNAFFVSIPLYLRALVSLMVRPQCSDDTRQYGLCLYGALEKETKRRTITPKRSESASYRLKTALKTILRNVCRALGLYISHARSSGSSKFHSRSSTFHSRSSGSSKFHSRSLLISCTSFLAFLG